MPTSVLERGRGYDREKDGFDPIATPNKLSRRETWKVSKRGREGRIGAIYRETGTKGGEEEGFHLRGDAVSKGPVCVTCVDRILDRLVSNIGNENARKTK